MKKDDVRKDMIITNGSSAIVTHFHTDRDPYWKTSGWRGRNIPLDRFGGNANSLGFVPDYLMGSWRPLSLEWSPVIGGGLEERYVWADGYRWLRRETRRSGEAGSRPA